jgi:potassium efflux system protein
MPDEKNSTAQLQACIADYLVVLRSETMMKNCWKASARILLVLALAGVVTLPASAKGLGDPPPTEALTKASVASDAELDLAPIAKLAVQIDRAEVDLDAISSRAHSPGISDSELRALAAAVPSIQARLANALDNITPRLQSADDRLVQLGAPPSSGQAAEDPEITQSRLELLKYRRSVDTEVKRGRLLETEADQLSSYIANHRRDLFSARLWVHGRSVLDPRLWRDFALALPQDARNLQAIIGEETARARGSIRSSADIAFWLMGLVAGLVILGPIRFLFNRFGELRLTALGGQAPLVPQAIAILRVAVAGLTPLFAGLAIRGGFASTGSLTATFDGLIILLIEATVFAALFERVGRSILAPRQSGFSVVPTPHDVVTRLALHPALVGASAGFAVLLAGANALLGSSRPTSEASQCIAILVELAFVGSALMRVGQARSAQIENLEANSPNEAGSRLPWVLAAAAAWVALGGALGAILFGYIALAGFVMREMIWVVLVLGALYLLIRFLDELVPTLLSPHRSVGRSVRMAFGVSAVSFEQIIELLAGITRLALLLCAWIAIIAPFGAGAEDVFGRVTSIDLVIRLGQLSISPGAIAGAFFVFGLGLVATNGLRGWLETRYLPKTRMDLGVRTSMASAVTYFGGLVALVVTCAYLGMSLDRIALFASALSVGIGFGLQSVIGNFVSGLILLAERPVKVGDWIAIGDLEGDVRRISVRATEIEMRDRSKLIVPNSDLISKTVRNVTRGDSVGRVKIVLLIESKADPVLVRDILLSRLAQHRDALPDPPPAVYLTDIRDGALEMTAFVYVPNPRKVYITKSDLLFQIVSDLKAHNIALASSSPMITMGVAERLIEPGISDA